MNTTREPGNEIEGLSVSVVVYRPDVQQLAQTLQSLAAAFDAFKGTHPAFTLDVCLVDNGGLPDMTAALDALRAHGATCSVIAGQGNVGYGRGHNLAIGRAASRYHLVLNPDIDLDANAFIRAVEFFEDHPDVGLLTPRIGDEDGHIQYLCRRYPASEALAMGLVNAVVPHEQLDAEVQKWCDEIMEKSPTAIAIAKRSFNMDTAHQAGIAGMGMYALKLYYDTEESKEGVKAFQEKRKPEFRKYAK